MFPRSLWTSVTHAGRKAVCSCGPINWKLSDHPHFQREITAHHGLVKCRPVSPVCVRNYAQLSTTAPQNYGSVLHNDIQLQSTALLFHGLVPLFFKNNLGHRSATVLRFLKEPCNAWMMQRRFKTTTTTKSVLKQGGLPSKRTVKGARTKQPSRANQPVPEEDPVGPPPQRLRVTLFLCSGESS